jgi:hypothetical protein
MYPTVISYYTQNTPYEKEAKHLIASCEKLHLEYEIDAVPNLGSWAENCCYKPKFILQKLEKLQKPVVWVDADAIFVQKPEKLKDLSADFGLCIIEEIPDEHPCKFITGTLYANHTSRVKQFLKEWDIECKKHLDDDFCDQIALRNLLLSSDANITNLSLPYYTVCDLIEEGFLSEDIVLIHFQASRTLRQVINGEVVPFWNHDVFSSEKKEKLLKMFI